MTTPELPAHDADYLRLAEYLHGECSAADAAQLERELIIDSGLQNAAEFLRLALASTPSEPPLDIDAGWAEITRRIDESQRPRSRFRRKLKRLELLVGVAAVLIFGWATYLSLAPVIHAHVNEHYEAPMESRHIVRLPDGSRATLEPGARLTYRASFFRPPRDLTLDGEARFQARPDAAHPFEVHANGVVAIAIGTVFTVRANPWEPTVHISVEEGIVRAQPDGPTGSSRDVHAGESTDITPASR